MKFLSSIKGQATSYLAQFKKDEPARYAAAQQAIGGLLIVDGFIGIDNPLGGKKRPGIFGTLTGAAFGAIFMVASIFVGNLSGINNMTAKTSGQVVSVGAPSSSSSSGGSTCSVTVKYTVDGKQYQSPSSSSSSSNCQLSMGETISLNYNPDKPARWSNDAVLFKIIFQVFFYVGLFVVASSLVTFVIRVISIIFGWKLLRDGRKLASTLPNGIELGKMISEIKEDFSKNIFGSIGASPLKNWVGNLTGQSSTSAPVVQAPVNQQEIPAQPSAPQSPSAVGVQPEQSGQPNQQ